MSSHLPYSSSYVNRTTSKFGTPSSYSRTTSAPSSNTSSLDRSVRGGSYAPPPPPTSSRSSSLSRYGSAAGRGYSAEATDRGKTPPPPAAERRPLTGGLRMGSTSRFGAPGIARSPLSEKSPTVFGVAPREEDKLQLVSRATSPTPPSTSAFLREKRATQDKTLTDWVPRPGFRPVCISAETQTDEDLKADSPTPPAVVENPRVASRWGNRIAAPRYSSVGGYSLSRKEPQVTSRYGGLGFKPEAETSTAKQPEPPKPQPPPRSDSLATVNKDFRKSVLNMDLSSQEQNKPPSLPSMKSRSNLNLTLNKSQTTNSLNQANGKQTTKYSSSSEESSTSEEESSSDESNCHRLKPPDPNRNSNNDVTTNKPPASPKSVLVKTVTAAALMKVQMPQERSVDENKKPYSLRKFDSGVREWWLESNKDIPSSLEVQNKINQNIQQQPESNIPKLNDSKGYTLRKFDSGEKSWWSESSSDAPLVEKKQNLLRAPSKTKLSASSPSNSETETKNNLKLKNSSSKLNIPKCGSVKSSDSDSKGLNNLYKSPSRTELSSESESKSLGIGKLYESGLSRTSSGISLGGKTPVVVESVRRSTVLDPPTEYTPGLLRLHGSYRPLRRVESGQRDWWLDEADEEATVDNKSPGRTEAVGGWVGPFQDIDHVLGNLAPPPAAFISPTTSDDDSDSSDGSWYNKVMAKQNGTSTGEKKVDDSTLQLYKDGDFGSYLDLDASINEQQEEFSNFTNNNRKNSIVLRTQLSVRVHAIIEKLLKSEGRELQRALFALKQIFKEDQDLVHEFVQNEGLSTLIKVGHDADQNYQNYILRALGQLMLYVDGMNGVINHPGTVQWLYDLVASRFRLLVKTALKLLIVFVEYSESNCVLLVKAIRAVDYVRRTKPWHNIMKLIKECQACDTELLIYAMSLINKTLSGLPDQDMYYDQVDPLEEQSIETVIRGYMSKQGVDLDLLRQFQIYEAVLRHEDGDDEKGSPLKQLDEAIRKSLLNRKNTCGTPGGGGLERRKSRRYSTGNSPLSLTLSPRLLAVPTSPSQQYSLSDQSLNINGSGGGGCETPTERRERRRERQRSFLRQQREAALRAQLSSSSSEEAAPPQPPPAATPAPPPPPVLTVTPAPPLSDSRSPSPSSLSLRIPPVTPASTPGLENGERNNENGEEEKMCQHGLVRDLSQKLANALHSPTDESKYPFSDMKGIISKAKEELAKSASRGDGVKSPTRSSPAAAPTLTEVKKTETELHWEEMARDCQRPLRLADLDFTDLASDEELDLIGPAGSTVGVVPPPPPPATPAPPPPAAPSPAAPPPPASPNSLLQMNNRKNSTPKKTKKTVKLFWKEVREDPIVLNKLSPGHLLWDELSPVVIDTQKLEHLFESRAKDLITKKQQEMNKNKEIIVLDHKRSNAINIGMTKLPPPRSIKTAILKMDATVMNREGIEKLLTMLPTEEERTKIQEAQASNPDLPLGSAEQFLLTLASISELPARLKLWAFKLDYENSEKETAERLMDLKQGMETLRVNKTFRAILGTLLSIGIFLNGSEVKGFQIEYLAKVPEVKDTVHKHSLLHHLCHMVMEKFPDATDLYSEIGAVTRASKVDFDELASNLQKMEQECKASFDHLKVISKHDGASNIKLKMSDFLADSAERIIILTKVHRRVLHRFQKFCLWLGFPLHRASLTKPNELCQVISEFALEYRTTRERVLQQLEKKANHKERTKTRGKMITEVGKFRSQEDRADAELKELLDKSTPKKLSEDSSTTLHGSLPWRRIRKSVEPGLTPDSSPVTLNGSLGGGLSDCDDEILESLVKTATRTPTARHLQPRDRKRTRNAERKSLRRTLRSGLTEEDQKHLAAYIKGY